MGRRPVDGSPMDELALRRFVGSEYPRVVAAVAAVCGDRAQAEDAVQEALARAWDRGRRGLIVQSLAAWVTTVAMNLSRSATRSALRRRRREERAVAPDDAVDDAGFGVAVDVLRAVEALPRRQREAVVVRYFLGYDVPGTAAVLGVSDGTVKTLLFRARTTLAAALSDTADQEVCSDASAR
jgi:RNA polymerase sigma-70 factor, ECF subfamily